MRIFLMALGILLACLRGPAPALAQSDEQNALELARRIASMQGVASAQVFVGKLPNGLPAIPLPEARIVGSVATKGFAPEQTDRFEVYYDGDPAVLAAYGAKMRGDGWSERPTPYNLPRGGFQPAPFGSFHVFCKAGKPSIIARLAAKSRDLSVGVSASMRQDACSEDFPGDMRAMLERMQTPLPDLQAPSGVDMTVSQAGNPSGASGAFLKGPQSVSALLQAFAGQFSAAGWRASSSLANDQLGSQSFHFTDAKRQQWQTVLTIYTSDIDPQTHYAFLDVTNLTAQSGMSRP